eukprot:CAMPEP_0198684498 /NCGR_PEP_ID=MMETSP1468-20131203/12304_1 /TAXON_ID=1461545 /ORGANISM="Mantoniella sp, Strain CCMP1436" /LENGTH=80 /DNA_ID=CAMNT_0044429361 /DNA_START=59 /DNA_END=302 /DNA_ORIENTATION=-
MARAELHLATELLQRLDGMPEHVTVVLVLTWQQPGKAGFAAASNMSCVLTALPPCAAACSTRANASSIGGSVSSSKTSLA